MVKIYIFETEKAEKKWVFGYFIKKIA